MITGRFAAPGKTRTCPHCRATILDSATVCPGCHHHLRFDSSGTTQRVQPAATPLRVEGTVRHPTNGGSWEYSVVLAIRNDRGEEIARQVVGVGALQPGDARTFSLAVEVFKPAELKESKPQPAEAAQRAGASDPKSPDVRTPGRPGVPLTPPAPRPGMPLGGGTSGAVPSAGPAASGSAPPKWPIPAAAAAAPGRYPPAAASPGNSGRYPVAPAQAAAPAKPPPAASPGSAAPSSAAPVSAPPSSGASGRAAAGQPLRAPQAPPLNGGGAAPSRGVGPGVQPKRP